MRVLHVLPYPGVGGTEIATRRVADALRPFGVEAHALLLAPTNEQIDYFHAAGIPTAPLVDKPVPSVRHGAAFIRDLIRLARERMNVDLIHCADVPAAYVTATAGRLCGVPVLAHVRNRQPKPSLHSRIFVGPASHFAFVSEETRRRFPYRVSKERTSVVYDGVDLPPEADLAERVTTARAVRQALGLADDAQVVAMFARVAPQKDYDTLIRAAALLRDRWPGLRFLIVGDFDTLPEHRRHYAHVRTLLAQAGVEDRFLFTGFRRDTRRLMLATDICVLSTHFEGLPLVILEAMALARPCVATAVDGVPEMIVHGATGLLTRPGDAADLANALARLLGDRDEARRLGANARVMARDRFGHERFARELYELYARLVRRSRRSSLVGVAGLTQSGARS